MAYDQPLDYEASRIVYEVRMWELGHSFDEIRDMSLEDFGNVIAYWREKDRAEKKLAEQRKNKKNARARG